jgi:hypothetical protein
VNQLQPAGLNLDALFKNEQEISTLKEHALLLGQLVSNFHALETWLRVTLLALAPEEHADAQIDFEGIPENTRLKETQFTNYFALGNLLEAFNKQMDHLNEDPVPKAAEIVAWRDAIAHGRTVGGRHGSDLPLRLIKFSKPSKNTTDANSGCVELVVNQLMSRKWFNERLFVTKHAVDTVMAASIKAEERALRGS